MTTVSTIAGAIPAAMAIDLTWLGLGASGGMELRAPMAVAVIGGLVVSTLLTLFVVPAVYAMFEDVKSLLGIREKPVPAPAAPAEPSDASA
jgi:HAE1 family hydrophobic/amphiphilic exporter-1